VYAPHHPPPDLAALVDHERLRSIRDDYADIAGPLIDVFEQSATETLAELRAAVSRGDEATTARLAHRLKGSARNVGASAIAALSADAEAGGADTPRTVAALQASLGPTCAALRAALV
jgi:HPt (histidine-containing phosphotransfer) domain-containing protein